MNILKSIKDHKLGILSMLLMIAAVALGADSGFAMAAVDVVGTGSSDTVTPSETRTPEEVRDEYQPDEKGDRTQNQGGVATATDVRDAKLEESDIDPRVAKFRPFRFPIESYIANKCRQQAVKSYEQTHYRSSATVLEDTYLGSSKNVGKASFTVSCSDFENGGASLTECSEVFVQDVDGYAEDGVTLDGNLALYVLSNDDETIKLVALNPKGTGTVTIPASAKFVVGATACSESQMIVPPESYLPESDTLYLQKQNAAVVITDEWNEMAKKVDFIKKDVLHNGLYNFKRKCARTHWLGRQARIDVKVKELNGSKEAVYFSRGILRQIPMIYTYSGDTFQFTDFMGINKLQFAKNSENNKAVAFCGLDMFNKIQQFAFNTSVHNGKVSFEEITEMGINVSRWRDPLGQLDIVYDPTLDDIGYQNKMVVIDVENAVRYYKRNEKQTKQDLKKTGESREAERTIISQIDCIGLKGYNAVLVVPAEDLKDALKLGGASTLVETVPANATDTSKLDTSKMYYCDHAVGSFAAGTVIKYSGSAWAAYDGELVAA